MNRKLYHIGILITAVISLIIIILSVPLLFPRYGEDKGYTYNHFEFTEQNGTWYTITEENGTLLRVSLRYGPRQLEDIPVRGNISEFKSYKSMIITFNPNESVHTSDVTMAMAETYINLVLHFKKNVEAACTQDHPACVNATKATCETADRPVIFLNNLGSPSIDIKGDCAIISGKGEDLVRAADRFMYGIYGVMR
jgi:hypothetical protein